VPGHRTPDDRHSNKLVGLVSCTDAELVTDWWLMVPVMSGNERARISEPNRDDSQGGHRHASGTD